MKLSILLAGSVALAWAAVSPNVCRAQFEVAPDHFEMANVEPFVQATAAGAMHRGSEQAHLRSESVHATDSSRTNLRTPESAQPQSERVPFGLSGGAVMMEVRNSSQSTYFWNRAAIQRVWTLALATLNHLWFRHEPVRRS